MLVRTIFQRGSAQTDPQQTVSAAVAHRDGRRDVRPNRLRVHMYTLKAEERCQTGLQDQNRCVLPGLSVEAHTAVVRSIHTPSSRGPADSERAESEGVRTGHREGKSAERRRVRSSVSRSRRGGEEKTDTEEDLRSAAAGR